MTDDERIIREALQAGPTPGDWLVAYSASCGSSVAGIFGVSVAWCGTCFVSGIAGSKTITADEAEANSHHIAACSPDRIERVLAELERLRAELAEANAELSEQARLLGISGSVEARLLARVAELEREVAEAKRNADRYRWLRAQQWDTSPLAVVVDPKRAVKIGHDLPSLDRLDAAIDRARGAE